MCVDVDVDVDVDVLYIHQEEGTNFIVDKGFVRSVHLHNGM